jgi:thioredoxin-related protein
LNLKVIWLLLLIPLAVGAQQYQYQYEYDDEDDDETAESDLPYVKIESTDDLQALGRQALAEDKVILIEMSASYCGYCRTLEENIIKPMLRSGDYEDYVLIRKLDIDSYYTLRGFDGAEISPSKYAFAMNAQLTPTLLFLDGNGNEVSERIVGINTLEMYGDYVDNALLEGHRKITR